MNNANDLINNDGCFVEFMMKSVMNYNNDDDGDDNENYEYLSYVEDNDDNGNNSEHGNSNNNFQIGQIKEENTDYSYNEENNDYNNQENNNVMHNETEINDIIIKTEYDYDDNDGGDDDCIIYDSGNDDDFDMNNDKQNNYDKNPNKMIIVDGKCDNFVYDSNDPHYDIMKNIEKLDEQQQLDDTITNNENENENNKKCNENDNSEDLYHCNTCNIVFSSVEEHLVEFHHNEDTIHYEKKTNDDKKSVQNYAENSTTTSSIKQTENFITHENIDANADTDYTNTNYSDENVVMNIKDNKNNNKMKRIKIVDVSNNKNDNSNLKHLEIEQITQNSISKTRNKINAVKNMKPKIKKEEFIINTIDFDDDLYHRKKFLQNSGNSVCHMCMRCNKEFITLKDAESHICEKSDINKDMTLPSTITVRNKCKNKKQEIQEPSYTCEECGIAFNSSRSVSLHKRIHKNSKTRITTTNNSITNNSSFNKPDMSFICTDCNTKFKSLKSLKLHSKMHKTDSTLSSFDRIINSEHTIIGKSGHLSNELFFCNICDKYYDKVFEDVHYKAHEIETKSIICMICNKKFDNETECSIHMKLHENHPQRRGITKAEIAGIQLPYECSFCGRQFKKPHEKVKHERIHTGEKPHKCDICGKSFRVAYCLTLHVRTHTNARPYVCPKCNKRFKSVSVYTHHLQSHSDERAYQCPHCPKKFKTAVSLSGHRKSHTKPFVCTECNRPFASLYAVKSHMEIHKKMKPNLKHSCIICGAIYAKIFALRDHIREQHKEITITNDLKIIKINSDEIISTNTNDVDDDNIDDIIDYDDDGIIMNDDTITVTEISDPSSIIIGANNHESLLNSKIDEITVVDLGNFHTEEIVTEWLE